MFHPFQGHQQNLELYVQFSGPRLLHLALLSVILTVKSRF